MLQRETERTVIQKKIIIINYKNLIVYRKDIIVSTIKACGDTLCHLNKLYNACSSSARTEEFKQSRKHFSKELASVRTAQKKKKKTERAKTRTTHYRL